MKEIYFNFVNLIQEMPKVWFAIIWLLTAAWMLKLLTKFYKLHDGTQKNIEKPGLLLLALVLFGVILFLTYIRI